MKINRESSCHILRLSSFEGFLKWGYTQIIHFSRSSLLNQPFLGTPIYHIIRSSDHQIIRFHHCSILIRETLRWALPELYGRGRGHCQSTPGVPAEDPADLDLQSSHSTCPWGKHPLNIIEFVLHEALKFLILHVSRLVGKGPHVIWKGMWGQLVALNHFGSSHPARPHLCFFLSLPPLPDPLCGVMGRRALSGFPASFL